MEGNPPNAPFQTAVATITATRDGHVLPRTTTAPITIVSTITAARLGLRSRCLPTHHNEISPHTPHANRIGPTKAGLAPLDSNSTLTKVYTVNCPRNENILDTETAVSARRPARMEPPEPGS